MESEMRMLPILLALEAGLPGGQGAVEEPQEHLQLLLRVQRSQWADGNSKKVVKKKLESSSCREPSRTFPASISSTSSENTIFSLVWLWGYLRCADVQYHTGAGSAISEHPVLVPHAKIGTSFPMSICTPATWSSGNQQPVSVTPRPRAAIAPCSPGKRRLGAPSHVQANVGLVGSAGSPGNPKPASHFRFTAVRVSWLSSRKRGGYISSENK